MEDYINESDPTLAAITTEIFAHITGKNLFKDYEPEWTGPTQTEKEALLNKPKPVKIINKPYDNRKDKEEDQNRRKSITLNDLNLLDPNAPTQHPLTANHTVPVNNADSGKKQAKPRKPALLPDSTTDTGDTSTKGHSRSASIFEVSDVQDPHEDPDHPNRNSHENCCFPIMMLFGKKPK